MNPLGSATERHPTYRRPYLYHSQPPHASGTQCRGYKQRVHAAWIEQQEKLSSTAPKKPLMPGMEEPSEVAETRARDSGTGTRRGLRRGVVDCISFWDERLQADNASAIHPSSGTACSALDFLITEPQDPGSSCRRAEPDASDVAAHAPEQGKCRNQGLRVPCTVLARSVSSSFGPRPHRLRYLPVLGWSGSISEKKMGD